VEHVISDWAPDEVYYVAAVHQASGDAVPPDDVELFERSHAVHVTGLLHFLEALSERRAGALFYAASSLVFGLPAESPQDETTPFRPRDIYGITKTAGAQACRYYREARGVRASVGILFNHESPLRRHNFVSQRIVLGAVAIAGGNQSKLTLGNLSARIDWGYAADYVRAMTLIVRNATPDDYVIATGETHSVQEFAEIAFRRLGLDWREHVVEDRRIITRESTVRVGNASRLRERTRWCPSVTFTEMVESLVDAAAKEHGR
jgi:GDPmannose 4,6-dehydratase